MPHREQADASLKTAERARYQAAFEEKFAPYVQQCVQNPDDSQKFEFVMAAVEDGSAQPSSITNPTPVAQCLLEKFGRIPPNVEKPFPHPPRSPYWIKLELDPAKFVVASR